MMNNLIDGMPRRVEAIGKKLRKNGENILSIV